VLKYKASKHCVREPISRKTFVIINYLFLTGVTIVSMMPLMNILAMSFSDTLAVAANEVKFWPVGFTLTSYSHVIANATFFTSFLISAKRAVLGVSIDMILSILAAYPLSKADSAFRARKFYVWIFMFTMVFSGGVVPLFMVVKYTHIYNTIWALIFPGAVNVFNILILMNFFRELPGEIEESAFIDGAGHWTILFKIYLPLAKAALATLVLFFFVGHWNSWFDGLIYMSNKERYPLQTYLQSILAIPDVSKMTPQELEAFGKINIRSIKAAEIFIAAVPILAVYPFLQKYFTKGIVLGSVKG